MKKSLKKIIRLMRMVLDIIIAIAALVLFVVTLKQGMNQATLPPITGAFSLLYVMGVAYFVPQLMGIGICYAAVEDIYTAVISKR